MKKEVKHAIKKKNGGGWATGWGNWCHRRDRGVKSMIQLNMTIRIRMQLRYEKKSKILLKRKEGNKEFQI